MSDQIELPEEHLLKFLKSMPALQSGIYDRQEKLTGDGSARDYFRIFVSGTKYQSFVILCNGNLPGPKLSGDTSFKQERSFIEVGKFLKNNQIPVPAILGYEEKLGWIGMEDVGDIPLWHFLQRPGNQVEEQIADSRGANFCEDFFKDAIKLIAKIQTIAVDEKCIAFRRYLSYENYRLEISEFTEFYAIPKGLKASSAAQLEKVFDGICETLSHFPRKLSFFDYNAHNIFVLEDGSLRVLDFQDACLVSPVRDLVSLINDRGIDDLLGKQRHRNLIQYYEKELNVGPRFEEFYNITLLHWDLRVAGRFMKLCQNLKTDKYQQWIPGTLRRLGATLGRYHKNLHGLDSVLEILEGFSPEVKEGLQERR